MMKNTVEQFDPSEKEARLRAESETWDTTNPQSASESDIPVLDLGPYFSNGTESELDSLAEQLRYASTKVGFYYVKGHGVDADIINQAFEQSRQFHDLPLDNKMALQMDQPGWPTGVGYLPFQNRKLPTRKKGNANEAFIVKRELGPRNVSLDDNQWPTEQDLPGFRYKVETYANALEALTKNLLPIYARALQIEPGYFDEGFSSPMYRLRMTKYPSIKQYDEDEFGIAPHVDTTFITILTQDSEGLTIYSELQKCWLRAPLVKDAFIINTGELLKQWTNDQFISVKHFANNNTGSQPRYSIPFFVNANSDYPMECIPSCCSDDNPAKYPSVSYLDSQAVVQGE